MGSDAEVRQPTQHGICVKALDGTVLSQNLKCIEICGDMRGQICKKGCMLNRRSHPDVPAVDEGVHLLSGILSDGHLVDAILLNDGENLTTYLLDKAAVVERKLALLKPYRLSEAETKIATLLLAGRTNREIAAAQFISISTVRTHIGNLYRKIPKEIRETHFR